MEVVQRTNDILRKVFIVVMVTVVPVALVVQLWHVITVYWLLITSFLLVGTGGIFIYSYFKAYDPKLIFLKFKKWLSKKWGMTIPSGESEKIVLTATDRVKGFLISGVLLEIAGIYLFTQFIKNH